MRKLWLRFRTISFLLFLQINVVIHTYFVFLNYNLIFQSNSIRIIKQKQPLIKINIKIRTKHLKKLKTNFPLKKYHIQINCP